VSELGGAIARSRARALACATLCTLGLACAPASGPGDRLYREGDLHGALESWRAADEDELAARIVSVQRELDRRAASYIESARALEEQGRLAESVLDYRLALALRPEDTGTLDHVQELARRAVSERAALLDSYRLVRARGDLGAARDALQQLRDLDPFEPAYQTEELRLGQAIADERLRRRERIREEQAARVEALVESGRAAFSEERLEDAVDHWRRALLIDPDNERIQAYISRARKQLESLERLRAEPEAEAAP